MGGRIVVEKEGALGWIVFDHPERRNAVSEEMWRAIPSAATELDEDPAIRVVLLRGSGEIAFVAGADISGAQMADIPGLWVKGLEQAKCNPSTEMPFGYACRDEVPIPSDAGGK